MYSLHIVMAAGYADYLMNVHVSQLSLTDVVG
jgi:hypothetical protein